MPSRSLPADARRALLLYRLLFPLVFLALLPGVLLRMWRRGGAREKFAQRLGRYSAEERARFASREWIWIHSISVGETLVALKLARALHEREPTVGVLLSTTTTTGFAVARKAAGDWLEPIYNPLDARFIGQQPYKLHFVIDRHGSLIIDRLPNIVDITVVTKDRD